MKEKSTKKTWAKPLLVEKSVAEVLKDTAKTAISIFFLCFSTMLMSQTISITEGCSSGTLTEYILPKLGVNDSGYNVYQLGNRLFQYNVVSKRWEYSLSGNVLFFNTTKSAKPLAPCSFKFDYTHTSNCSDTTFNVLTDCTTLPVELLYFNGIKTNKGVLLSWKTVSEVNNKYFEIEVSSNAKDFNSIAFISAQGSGYDYKYLHSGYDNGISYYRLKQVDNDGKVTIFKTLSIEHNLSQLQMIDGVIYADGRIEVYSIDGRLLHTSNNSVQTYSFQKPILVRTKQGVIKVLK